MEKSQNKVEKSKNKVEKSQNKVEKSQNKVKKSHTIFFFSEWFIPLGFINSYLSFRFDFLREIPQTGAEVSKYSSCKSFQFIHVSGSILVKINDMLFQRDSDSPTLDQEGVFKSPFGKRQTKRFSTDSDDDQFKVDLEYKNDVGFFWVYNYALTKKWRSSATGNTNKKSSIHPTGGFVFCQPSYITYNIHYLRSNFCYKKYCIFSTYL